LAASVMQKYSKIITDTSQHSQPIAAAASKRKAQPRLGSLETEN
jgi:hypothetical protein